MTDREGVQRITADEAAAALTAAAWTERISEEKYEAAVEAVLALTGEDGAMIPASRIRDVIRDHLGTPRTLIHCFMGGLGADWDLAAAVEMARRGGAQCAWAPHMLGHDLAVFADGSMHRFEARRPAPASPAHPGREG